MGALLALMFVAKLGPRRLFAGGMIVTTLALLASGLTRDFWFLSLWRVLAGLGGAPAFIAGGAMVSTLFRGDPSRNAMAIAVYGGGGGLGTLLTALLIPSMLTKFSIGYIVYITFLISWMRSQGAGTALTVATWAVLSLAVMLSPMPWRRLLTRVQGGQALALACLATGVGTLLPLVVPGPAGLLLSAATFGGSLFIAPTAITAFGRKNLPEASWGRSVALFTCVFAVGQTLGPVVAGALADATESLAPGLIAAAVTLFLGAAVAARQVALRN
jgi:MFS family permease